MINAIHFPFQALKLWGITPRQLQILLDFPYVQTVYNWYQGKNMPTIDNLVVLAQVLGVTMDDIAVTRMISVEIDDVEGVEVLSSNPISSVLLIDIARK